MADIEAYLRQAALMGQRGSLESIGQRGANYGNLTTFVFITLFVSWLVFFTVFLVLTIEDQNISTNLLYGLSILVGICLILCAIAYFSWLTNIGSYIYGRIIFSEVSAEVSKSIKGILDTEESKREEKLRAKSEKLKRDLELARAKEQAEIDKAQRDLEVQLKKIKTDAAEQKALISKTESEDQKRLRDLRLKEAEEKAEADKAQALADRKIKDIQARLQKDLDDIQKGLGTGSGTGSGATTTSGTGTI